MSTRALILGCVLLAGCGPLPVSNGHAIDGDTVELMGKRLRIENIDAPEIRGLCEGERWLAVQATRRLQELLDRGVHVTYGRKDVYGRTLVRMTGQIGQDIGDQLVAEQLARPWEGSRQSWCREKRDAE